MASVSGSTQTPASYIRDLQEDLEEEIQTARQKTDAQQTLSDKRAKEQASKLERAVSDATDRMRKDHEQSFVRERENQRTELNRLKAATYDRQAKHVQADAHVQQTAMEQVQRSEEQMKEALRTHQEATDTQIRRANLAARNRAEHDAEVLREAHQREVSNLSEQLDYAKQEYDRDLSLQRSRDAEKTESSQQKNNERLDELARANAERMRALHSEHKQEENRIQGEYNKDKARLQDAREQERESFHSSVTRQKQEMDSAFQKTTDTRSKAYEESFKQQKGYSNQQINDLETELQFRRTSADPNSMSPQAEHTLRERLAQEFDQQTRARESIHQKAYTDLMNQGRDQLRSLASQTEREKIKSTQELARVETEGRTALTQQVMDSDFQREQLIRSKDAKQDMATQKIHRHYSSQLEDQRRQYEEILEAFRNDAAAKSATQRQEAEFALRMERRTSAAQQNELTREYEKRLSDQKDHLSEELKGQKLASEKAIRDLETKHRQDQEQQARLGDQHTAQLEQQYQERERVSARNYQDQIEKLKRSNALLQSKKS